MHNSNSGIKQWPLVGALSEVHGKQIIGPATVMYACEADGVGGWRTLDARPAIRHEVRLTRETVRQTGAPVMQVVSIDTLSGRETVWPNGGRS